MATWAEFILSQIQEMEKNLGRRVSNKEFGEMLGVSGSTISQWVNGKYPPSSDSVSHLSDIFGMEVYDVLGMTRPDPDFRYISKYWDHVPDELHRQMRELIEEYIARKT